MQVAVLGDLHFGARNDNLEFLDYFERFFNEVFFPEIKRRKITHVIQLGDFVDRRKFINFVTLRRIRNILKRCQDEGITMDVIIGNHDTPYKNTSEINSMKELFSTVNDSFDYVNFYSEPTEKMIGTTRVLLLPWINLSNHDASMAALKDTKAKVLFAHIEIKGFEMYRGMPSHEGFDMSFFDKFEHVATGHFHHRHTKGNINYYGTPYEITWADYGDNKGFHIFDTNKKTAEFIASPFKMFHKVWYDDEGKTNDEVLTRNFDPFNKSYVKLIVQNKTNPFLFDLFLSKIYEKSPLDVTIVEDHRNMQDISEEDLADQAEDTLTILSKYIGQMETNVNKDELDKYMRTLYNEALNMETAQ